MGNECWYNLSVEGKFNDIPETLIWVDFLLEKQTAFQNVAKSEMNQPPSIKKDDGGVYGFE